MLALLVLGLAKNRALHRIVPCPRTPRGTQYDVQSMHHRRNSNFCEITQRSIHTQRDASRKISALVKRMGVQVSYLAVTLALVASGVPAGCGF